MLPNSKTDYFLDKERKITISLEAAIEI